MAISPNGPVLAPFNVSFTREMEVAAFDALGPLVRRALSEMPLQVMALPVIQDIRRYGLNPRDPAVDGAVANNLRNAVCQSLAQEHNDITLARAAMTPLRPRRLRARQR